MTRYAAHVAPKNIPQSEPLAGQSKNSAGGHSWTVDCWTRLDRFLILGAEGGSYYASERKLAQENAQSVLECHKADPVRTVNRIVEVSDKGLAPKNDPAIFALAMLSHDPVALAAVPLVCRIGTHIFQFAECAQQFRGWGRGLRRAIAIWYRDQDADALAYQIAKYQNRNGWSHHDLLHKCHAKPTTPAHAACHQWAKDGAIGDDVPPFLSQVRELQLATDDKTTARLIREHRLPREVVPTERLNSPEVWEALLENMPLTAMLRNLGKMANVGLLKPMATACLKVAQKLADETALKKARVHPLAVLMALSIYRTGHGLKGSLTWQADSSVVDALDAAFYNAFAAVEPTGKRHLLALDASGSMGGGQVGGSFLSPREASAAMAMVTVKTEALTHAVAFTGGHSQAWGRQRQAALGPITPIDFGRTTGLGDAVQKISNLPFGATDCALPMLYAMQAGIEADAFIVYTDSETWAGSVHPAIALQEYRRKTGINAKLIVVGMVSNGFTIADPNDAGMLDVVGFSADAPAVMRQFVA